MFVVFMLFGVYSSISLMLEFLARKQNRSNVTLHILSSLCPTSPEFTPGF